MSIAKRRKNRQRKSMADLQQTLRAWGFHPQWCGIDALKHVNQAFDMAILRLKMGRELKEALVPRSLPTEDEIGELARRGGEALGPDVTQEDIKKALTAVLAEVAEHRRTVEKGMAGAICVLGPNVFGDELVAKAKETLKTSEMNITDEDSLP